MLSAAGMEPYGREARGGTEMVSGSGRQEAAV